MKFIYNIFIIILVFAFAQNQNLALRIQIEYASKALVADHFKRKVEK